MKCYVTGANGFIGSAIVRKLLGRGHEVTALVGCDMDCSSLSGLDIQVREVELTHPQSVRRALQGGEALFHAAACYSFWRPRRQDIYDINVQGTRHILAAAREWNYKRVVYTSTAGTLMPRLWSMREPIEADEDALMDFQYFQGDYKTAKCMAEILLLREMARGLPAVIVHPTVVLGPGDRRPTPTGEMIVHHLNGRMKAFVNMQLNIVDVEDVAEGQVLALERGRAGERYILGGENISMRDMLALLSDLTGIAQPRVALPPALILALGRVNEAMAALRLVRQPIVFVEAALHAKSSKPCSNAKARHELGFYPRAARVSLARAALWFAQNGNDRLLPTEQLQRLERWVAEDARVPRLQVRANSGFALGSEL